MRGRKFRKGCVIHIYQRAVDKGVIFYSVADRLVFYSTCASVMARYGIPCHAAAIMFTHTHLSVTPESLEQIDACVRDYSSSFARAYNHEHRRNGDLYDRPYGRSIKRTSKEARSNLIYVFNNHVEKKLCRKAKDERWSFLAFSLSSHPFSEPLVESRMSKRLRRALRLVNRHVRKHQPLKYSDVKSVLKDLDSVETEQYIDYVISSYHLVKFDYGKELFGSISNLIEASECVTGDEWDIHEDFYGASDVAYKELCTYCRRLDGQNWSAYDMSTNHKMSVITDTLKIINANGAQLSRFFHCELPWR